MKVWSLPLLILTGATVLCVWILVSHDSFASEPIVVDKPPSGVEVFAAHILRHAPDGSSASNWAFTVLKLEYFYQLTPLIERGEWLDLDEEEMREIEEICRAAVELPIPSALPGDAAQQEHKR